ncbi:hypothetical protein LX36DRAFT_703176 [Colletotrichum falcatum]|nr:hypothetical protein LX36DRAFT_703176 [Colletotrichum falcatum]
MAFDGLSLVTHALLPWLSSLLIPSNQVTNQPPAVIKSHMAYFETEDARWQPEPDGPKVGTWWAIDTEQGQMHRCIYPHRSSYLLFEGHRPLEAAIEWWLNARAVTFAELFSKIADELSSLELVPIPEAGNIGKHVAYRHGDDTWVRHPRSYQQRAPAIA